MKKILLLVTLLVIFSCQNNTNNNAKSPYINLSNLDTLSAYISKIPPATDTIFMGFRLGMNKEEFKSHIKYLRKNNITVNYKRGINRDRIKKMGGLLSRYSQNGSYQIINGVSAKDILEKDKVVSGYGKFTLFPIYDKNEGMIALIVIDVYDWEDNRNRDGWLFRQSKEKYEAIPQDLKLYFENYGLDRSDYRYLNNVYIKKDFAVYYISKKEVFKKILQQKYVNKLLEKQSDKITF